MPRPPRREDHEPTRDHTLAPGLSCMLFIGDRSSTLALPPSGTVIVGRGTDADLVVAADGVSRKHVRLEVVRDRATVHDLGSKNGTWVNDQRVKEPREVGHGDEIRFGDARLVLSRRTPGGTGPSISLHGAFVSRLRIEVARAIGFGRPLSLLLVGLGARWVEVSIPTLLTGLVRPVDVVGVYDDSTLELALLEMADDGARRVEATLLERLEASGATPSSGAASLVGRAGSAEDLMDRALAALHRARGEAPAAAEPDGPVLADPVMLRIHDQIRRIAPSPISVLLTGETGAGKEVFAREIHRASRRRGQLVSVNAAALPESLLESELFGHERGAFTGATQPKAGLFEAAHQGTLFLDEIGELPLPMQAKLLRVLEDQTVRRVGGSSDRKVDVRIVAATNSELAELVEQRRFRRDLLFRLNACTLVIPPLRDRPLDVPELAERFLARSTAAGGRRLRLSPEVVAALQRHGWPGNVRELKNVIERAAAMCEGTGGVILLDHLPDSVRAPVVAALVVLPTPRPGAASGVRDAVQSLERQRILEALDRARGNQTKAAEILGLPRKTLTYRLEKLGIRPKA